MKVIGNKDVVIFTMKECVYCDELKERLDTMKIEYEEYDIVTNEELFNKICEFTKTDTVPLIFVGKTILVADHSFKTIEEASIIIQQLVQ